MIKKILFEEVKSKGLLEGKMLPKNKFAKVWLSRYNNLKKYKSADGDFIYLATPNGSILVRINVRINETEVSPIIWDSLTRVLTNIETRRKIISWLIDEYSLLNLGYVFRSDRLNSVKIRQDDVLVA